MKLVDISIRRPVTTTMAVIFVILLGVISLGRLNLDLFPNMNFPVAAVITDYPGVGSHEIETMVSRPLESAIATVTSIKSLSSTSQAGQSLVLAEFDWGVDMNFATLEMREKVDMVKGFLPEDAGNPIIVKFDPSMMPIMQLGVSGSADQVELKHLVEDKVVPRLERLDGVASVGLTGGLNREILIEVQQTRLNHYGINLSTLAQTLMLENMNLSGGKIVRGQTELLVRTTGKFNSIEEIKRILVPTTSGIIALEDVAEIKDTYKEVQSLAQMNGQPSIGITIQKQTDANTVRVANRVNEELAMIKQELAGQIQMHPVVDQAQYVKQSITNVQTNAIIGGILAVLVLFFFLRNLGSTIIIATAIPVSVITTFTLIYFSGLTLNMMTLGGLALGVGMLVDNAIVVLENIYRYRQEGYDRKEAASKGTQEVGMAILASTLTTIIVFLPVVYVQGLASQLFKELALTISFSLLASLVIALTFIPMLSSKILRLSNQGSLDETSRRGVIGWLQQVYRKTLDWSLSNRWVVILIVLLALGGCYFLYPQIGTEFIPAMDQGEFIINVRLPIGTVLEETRQTVAEVEELVMQLPEVETVFSEIGTVGLMVSWPSPEFGQIMVRLKPLNQRERSTNEVIEELRQELHFPDTVISMEAQNAFGGGMTEAPISIQVRGNNLKVLEKLALEISAEIAKVEGVRNVRDSISKGRPEIQIQIDRVQAAQFGLRVTQVAATIKAAIQGEVATRYEVDGQEYDVRVRLQESDRKSLSQVENLLIPSPLGAKVPLDRIATFNISQGPKAIERENQVRYVAITADLFGSDLGTAMEKIQKRIQNQIKVPDQYEITYRGQYQEMMDSFKNLAFALVLAIVLVYMVLASQFESLLHPFVIMFSVPLAIIGVFVGLYVTGHNISVPSLIGMIMLAGIVVNNAIVLVDYINTLRGQGMELREAILEAGPVRLRPIMMTALTTILGLIPLALGLGEGSEVQSPMAVVVIGGLLCATLLTLYIVPILYTLFEGFQTKVKQLLGMTPSNSESL